MLFCFARLSGMETLDPLLVSQLYHLPLLRGMSNSITCTAITKPEIDVIRFYFGNIGQILHTICRRLRYIRNQMHHRRLRHEGILGRMDTAHQVHWVAAGYCIWSLGG